MHDIMEIVSTQMQQGHVDLPYRNSGLYSLASLTPFLQHFRLDTIRQK